MNVNQIEQEQIIPPAYICYSYFDNCGQVQWAWVQEYYNYFAGLIACIQELKKTVNKKWTKEQSNAYQTFLTDLENYINAYVMTWKVADYNVFEDAMNIYSTTTNPLGR